jgi:hypothetical protein
LSKPIDFVRDFLNYVEKVGIFDEFDKESQKMITSAGVQSLIQEARSCLPEKLKPVQAANRMRDLNEAERDALIQSSEKERVIDMRKEFQKKMSENGGAMGIVERLVETVENSDMGDITEILQDAKALIKGPENVEPLENTSRDND